MGEKDPWFDRMRARFRLEHGLHARRRDPRSPASSSAAVIVGIWIDRGFGELSEERLAVTAATLIIVGLQIFFSSFLLSILGLRRRGDEPQPTACSCHRGGVARPALVVGVPLAASC